MINTNRSKKILLLFLLLLLGFAIFLSVMFVNAFKTRKTPSLYTSETSRSQRGNIISADGFHIATTQKLYKAMVNTRNIDPEKRELFIALFSIYSGIDPKELRAKLKERSGTVVLSYQIDPKRAQYLKSLAFELLQYKVFVEYESAGGERIFQGLSILESGETREYPYGTLLTPLLGYPHKIEDDGYTRVYGVKGLEKRFDETLSAQKEGRQYGLRDVNNYMILNRRSITELPQSGFDIKLTIPVTLQIKLERIVEGFKAELDANEVTVVIMESESGRILALASSNRFHPKAIRKEDYGALNTSAIEYSYETGSVIKPITFALLLEKGLVNPYDLVNGHNGRFRLGKKMITDEHKMDQMSAEDVIVYSSNIGIAQLAQKLSGVDLYEGFLRFGLTQPSGIDLPYERTGVMPTVRQLNHEIYKATVAYGYGIQSNLMQLLKAYNAFNNMGRVLNPRLTEGMIDTYGRFFPAESPTPRQVISAPTAERMKKILIKTVHKGTGTRARTEGLEIGGKTGTAHIAEKGRYVNKYNTSFIGFANDATKHYTIGVNVIQPRKSQFASLTSVPAFKAAVDLLIDDGYLHPDAQKFPLPLPETKH